MNLGKLFGAAIVFVSINIFESQGITLLDHASTRVPWHHDTLSDGLKANDALDTLETLGNAIIARNGAMPLDLTNYNRLWSNLPGRHRNYISAAVLMSKIYEDTSHGTQFDHGFSGTLEGCLISSMSQYGMPLEGGDIHDMRAYFNSADSVGWFKAKINAQLPSASQPLRGFEGSAYQPQRIDPWQADGRIELCEIERGERFKIGELEVNQTDTVLIALTDLHNRTGNYGQIVAKVQRLNERCRSNKKIVVINGDFIDANYGSDATQAQQDTYFSAQITPLLSLLSAITADRNTEVVLNMGNHDLSTGAAKILPCLLSGAQHEGISVRLINCNLPLKQYPAGLHRYVVPFVEIGNVIIIGYCPNSAFGKFNQSGRDDRDDIARLKRTLLDIVPINDSIILAAHIRAEPPKAGRKQGAVQDFAHSLPQPPNFHTILCGHAHSDASFLRWRDHSLLTPPPFGEGIGVMIIHPDGTNGKMRFW